VERSLAAEEIEALIAYQVAALAAVAPIAYIKPHGAMYHRCQRDAASADGLARVAKTFGVGLMGQPGFEIVAAATRAGVPAHREGFADRLMLPDGSPAPRTQAGALLNPSVAAQQAVRLARSGRYDTICVHGDTPGAGQIAAAGVMAGAISQAAFCVAYAWTAQRWGWTVSLIAAAAGFVAITIGLNAVALPTAGFFVVIIVVIVVSLFLMPQPGPTRAEPIE